MKYSSLSLLSATACLLVTAVLLYAADASLPVVPKLELNRYQGKWYEIARLPNRFQRKCQSNVVANYSIEPDGKIGVLNTCLKENGETDAAKATAHPKDRNGSPAKLKVTFFWPFSGDYWVIGLDPEYQWAIVGTPNRRYLWILSRKPSLAPATYNQLLQKARHLGFDTTKVEQTKQHW
jgi:apolipoprotein D and lipocalin family protein